MNPFRSFLGAVDAVERRAPPVRASALAFVVVFAALAVWRTVVWVVHLPPAPEGQCHDSFELRTWRQSEYVCSHSAAKLVAAPASGTVEGGQIMDVRCICPRNQ